MLAYVFRLNTAILILVLLLSGCGSINTGQTNLDEEDATPQDASAALDEDEITPTPEATTELAPDSTVIANPEATEPGVAELPRLNYYWPTVFPRGLVIDPTQSTITEDGYELALQNPTDRQWSTTIRGGTLDPPPPAMSEPQTVRGYEGQASTTGSGYGLYWDEGDYQYGVGGFLGLEDTLAIADSLEVVSFETWQDRLANAPTPDLGPPRGTTVPESPQLQTAQLQYYWPIVIPQNMVIDPAQSTIAEDGYELALRDPAGGQWYATIRGGTLASPPPMDGEAQTIRGYEGQAVTTGAGYGLHWSEDDYPYEVVGGVGLEDALAIAENLESVSIEILQDRLNHTPDFNPSGGFTEPGVAELPRLNYYWPTVFPRGLVIDPTQSNITEDGYELALRDPTGGQWSATIRGGTLDPPPPAMSEPQTVRGYEGQASTTGAGYGLYWDEGDYQYEVGGGLGLEDALAIADSLEVVSIDIWQERLAESMQE